MSVVCGLPSPSVKQILVLLYVSSTVEGCPTLFYDSDETYFFSLIFFCILVPMLMIVYFPYDRWVVLHLFGKMSFFSIAMRLISSFFYNSLPNRIPIVLYFILAKLHVWSSNNGGNFNFVSIHLVV
jgi:hypothetical protein